MLNRLAVKQFGVSIKNLITLPMREIGLPAKRPPYLMPCLDIAMSPSQCNALH
ncbi:hypothetical protein [Nostoc sp. PCC 7524]|uniref:hypothetical protein n=1 Tax=Nostoc sp. (strain ATCC 29411 / PCC 7524) TaxID=28072 RepID=UPI000ABBF627|nr:hypothetical protein [Nostoc sp. PCC 7524]